MGYRSKGRSHPQAAPQTHFGMGIRAHRHQTGSFVQSGSPPGFDFFSFDPGEQIPPDNLGQTVSIEILDVAELKSEAP